MIHLNRHHEKALKVLAGCPEGATEGALALNGIARATLDYLVAAGLARMNAQRIAKLPTLAVARFWITAAGRNLPPADFLAQEISNSRD